MMKIKSDVLDELSNMHFDLEHIEKYCVRCNSGEWHSDKADYQKIIKMTQAMRNIIEIRLPKLGMKDTYDK